MRYSLLIAVLMLAPSVALGQAPPYQRTRGGAHDWQARGGHAQHWRGPYEGYGGFYAPYFPSPPIVTGSYYQRPYPYHFDYFRDRWAAEQPAGSMEPQLVAPDCPCADPAPAEVVP